MGRQLIQKLATVALVIGGFACGGAGGGGSEGVNSKDQLERIKKADSEGKKLSAKQRELLNESKTETEDSAAGSK